ncbi:hypothetical protein DFP81_11712 [Marinomonas pollencensis]|uniref:Uncharacterized protein n=1 Tax=Marinomonas pollencensis TaxID=491954 RepID=A0A3E0DEF0_9GAMM|nr:hypothetical protein DFP81_1175 [Marinomonas pollencensis]REG81004.1 hypothetical protein DFP81_11712 [Marinomonas pollencensis]
MNDLIINKLATIDRCLKRIREVYSLQESSSIPITPAKIL